MKFVPSQDIRYCENTYGDFSGLWYDLVVFGKRLAILETGLIRDSFFLECTFSADDILREGFYP